MDTTNIYDLNWYHDPDNTNNPPRIYAFEVYKDENGWWTVNDSNYPEDSYEYTQEDIEWTLINVNQHNNTPYPSISELYVDEWFSTDDEHLYRNQLPPKALEWIEALPAYEYIDNTTEEAREYQNG
jgi:hypothetical protein